MIDDPTSLVVGRNLPFKFRVNPIFSFEVTAIFIFWRWLETVYSRALGVGAYFPR